MLCVCVLFYLFTPWQALVLIGIAALIWAVLYGTGRINPLLRSYSFGFTDRNDKREASDNWTIIPAKNLLRRDLAIYANATLYHSVFEYKVDRDRVLWRLIEKTEDEYGKGRTYPVRDGVIGSWLIDYIKERGTGYPDIESLKKQIEWHEAPPDIRYFVLNHTPAHSDFLSAERQRLKRAFAYVDGEIKRLGLKQDKYGAYVAPDGSESDAAKHLLSKENLSKYGILPEEFYSKDILLRVLRRF